MGTCPKKSGITVGDKRRLPNLLRKPEVHLLERSSFHGFLVGEWKGKKFQFPTDMGDS